MGETDEELRQRQSGGGGSVRVGKVPGDQGRKTVKKRRNI